MKSLKEIQATIDEKNAAILAIEAVIKEEDRDETPEETKFLADWYGTDDTEGELDQLNKQLATAQRREQKQAELKARAAGQLQGQLNEHVDRHSVSVGNHADVFSKIVVPRTAQRRTTNHFESKQEAYGCGQWIRAVVFGDEDAATFCREHGLPIHAAMSTGDSSKGGFLVPEPLEAAIIRLVESRGVFRRFARQWPMSSAVDNHPRRESGLTGYWVGENEEVTASDVSLGNVELVAKCLAVLTKVSKRLNQTSVIQLADWLANEMAYTIADKEDEAGFNGDGTSNYGGITGVVNALNAGSIVTAASGNVSFATLDHDDFENAAGTALDVTGANNRWFISKKGYHKSMGRLKANAPGNTKADIEMGADQVYDGDDVIFTNVLPKTDATSTIQAIYGDLSLAATLGTLMGFSIESNGGGEYFKQLQVAILGYEDVAINVHERGTATEAGVLIGLQTAAS